MLWRVASTCPLCRIVTKAHAARTQSSASSCPPGAPTESSRLTLRTRPREPRMTWQISPPRDGCLLTRAAELRLNGTRRSRRGSIAEAGRAQLGRHSSHADSPWSPNQVLELAPRGVGRDCRGVNPARESWTRPPRGGPHTTRGRSPRGPADPLQARSVSPARRAPAPPGTRTHPSRSRPTW